MDNWHPVAVTAVGLSSAMIIAVAPLAWRMPTAAVVSSRVSVSHPRRACVAQQIVHAAFNATETWRRKEHDLVANHACPQQQRPSQRRKSPARRSRHHRGARQPKWEEGRLDCCPPHWSRARRRHQEQGVSALSLLLRMEEAASFEVHAAAIRSGVACTVGVDFFHAAVRWGGGTSSKGDVEFDEAVAKEGQRCECGGQFVRMHWSATLLWL